jgi:hypothetical protein
MTLKHPEKYCVEKGLDGGFYIVSLKPRHLFVIASNGGGWDHVSVSLKDRCPTWEEMCFIKDLFFEPEDCVIQYHPPKSQYVNTSNTTLHMWRPHNLDIPMPPLELV